MHSHFCCLSLSTASSVYCTRADSSVFMSYTFFENWRLEVITSFLVRTILSMQGIPFSSCTVASPWTDRSFFASLNGRCFSMSAFLMPCCLSFSARAGPIPHIVPHSVSASRLSISSSSYTKTPPCSFAFLLYSFARVFVGAAPTQIGIPISRYMRRLRSCPISYQSEMENLHLLKKRNDSSMEYSSISGAYSA